jgi:hypothetical protein
MATERGCKMTRKSGQEIDTTEKLSMYGIAIAVWAFPFTGMALLIISQRSQSIYDLIVGIALTFLGGVGATIATLFMINEINRMKDSSRRLHPSYPHRIKVDKF